MMDTKRTMVWMRVAKEIATMSTCPRRAVGCVILSDLGHVLATGFNGVPSGMTSCFDDDCGASLSPTRDSLDKCIAVHAEMNALMQLRSPREASVIVTTSSPCKHCMKMLLNTSIKELIFEERYDSDALVLWLQQGRRQTCVTL